MKIIFRVLIFVLIVTAFGAGIYFRDDAIKFYNSASWRINKQVQKVQTTDIGLVINQASKELLTPPPLTAYKNTDSAILLQSKIITETNLQRQQNGGLPVLIENEKLNEAAAAKAGDILAKQYFEHVSPSGVGPGELAQKYGYDYIVEGENLILGNFSSEKEVVQDWMNSPGHRANILNNRYTEIGVAIIKGTYKGETVWVGVQEFGLPLSSCNQPNIALKNRIDSDNSQLDVLLSQIDEGKKQIDSINSNSAAYRQMVVNYNAMVEQYNSLAQIVKTNVAIYNDQVNTFNICVAGK
jgi:uncharacterized protein YkwD